MLRGVDGVLVLCWGLFITMISSSEIRLSSGLEMAYAMALHGIIGPLFVGVGEIIGGLPAVLYICVQLGRIALVVRCLEGALGVWARPRSGGDAMRCIRVRPRPNLQACLLAMSLQLLMRTLRPLVRVLQFLAMTLRPSWRMLQPLSMTLRLLSTTCPPPRGYPRS